MTDFFTILSIILSILLFLSWRAQLVHRRLLKEKYKLAQQKLQEEFDTLEKELKLLLNAFDDALLITDEKGVINVANLSAKQLCNRKVLRGKTVTQAFINQTITQAIQKTIESGQPYRDTLTLPTSSFGASADVQESSWILDVAPLDLENHEPLFRVIMRDITAEHKADQIKREFVANASHELRTPLSIINGYLENLIEDGMLEHPEMASKFLKTMQKHGLRLSKLVEDMLSVSKLESSDSNILNMKELSVRQVFEEIRDRLAPLCQENNSTIHIELDDPEQTIFGDRFYWEQIFFNLTENALKQNANRQINLTLTAKIENDQQILQVKDTGMGIPAEHLPYIFNRFYRVQKHHSQNEIKGTGLGLAIVKHAVELHGGEISVSSRLSEQTTFTIKLPVSNGDAIC